MRLIGQDIAVQISDGGAQDGAANWGAAASVKAYCKSLRVDDKLETAEVTALGDTRRKLRGKRGMTTVEIVLLVNDTGLLSIPIGNYMKIEYKPISSLGAFTTFIGLVTSNTHDLPDGEQTQTYTLECDAE